ncbi:MAG: hypothetical protein LAP39_21435 [Acidobacteriia bacterium]|nr:hypothetical protein [Terriglobia bacterium]
MSAVDVLTNRYNTSRTGANLSETVLNQTNVNVNGFGKVFARGVDGQIYAQPLTVSDLEIAGVGQRSVVFVATTRNMVYAFDAENADACHPLWRVNLDGPNAVPVPRGDYGADYNDITGEIGIISTPAIDRASGTMYVTAKSKEVRQNKPHYFYKLHALDLGTGAEKLHGPKIIAETIVNDAAAKDQAKNFTFVSGPAVKGTGSGSAGGTINFNAFFQLQRPGLLLQDQAVYLAFASQGDKGTYHGWVLACDATTLELLGAYCTTPDWGEGGIWQSGCGLAGDGTGNVFAVCGNGKGGDPGAQSLSSGPFFGHSVIKLKLDRQAKALRLEDWFTPFDIVQRNGNDDDLCAGPVILPWGNLVGAWGKDKAYYIMDRGQMGKFKPGQNAIAQFAPNMTMAENPGPAGGTGHIHCAPVMFSDPIVGPVSYVWGENDKLRGYPFDTHQSKFDTQVQPNLISQQILPIGMPGGMLTISCNGANPATAKGTAILWATHPTEGNANHQTVAGVLQAFRADDLTQAIWSSNHDPRGTDDLGDFAKFCPPVVANGRVYVATFSQQLVVYGLLTEGLGSPLGKWLQEDIPVQGPGNRTFQVEGTASFSCQRFTILGAGHDIWDPSDAFHYVYQPVGAGAVTITARVASVQNTSDWAKAGVMIRASLDADSPHAMAVVTPGNGAAFQFRPAKGAQSVHMPFTHPVKAPFWVRVVRTPQGGSFQFAGFVSADGSAWLQVGVANIPMGPSAFAGMVVTAHSDPPNPLLQDLCAALIDRVTLTS